MYELVEQLLVNTKQTKGGCSSGRGGRRESKGGDAKEGACEVSPLSNKTLYHGTNGRWKHVYGCGSTGIGEGNAG